MNGGDRPPVTIAFAGGIPPSLGGGGLELQMEHTAGALGRAGYDVFHVAREDAPREFDVLHAFGTEPDVWHLLRHWRRSPAPLVVSPVLVVPPDAEGKLRRVSRVPVPDLAPRMRVDVLRRAAAVIALTEHERDLLTRLAGSDGPPVEVIGNGVDPDPGGSPAPVDVPERYVLLLGTVSARKRQRATVEALGRAGVSVVIAGGFEGDAGERRDWEVTVEAAGARWLGEVTSPGQVRALLRGATALVHLSEAEGQSLALLEALAEGTPVIASPLPANRELAERHPRHVRLADGPDAVAPAVTALGGERLEPAPVPTWDDVAARLAEVYERVLGATASSAGT